MNEPDITSNNPIQNSVSIISGMVGGEGFEPRGFEPLTTHHLLSYGESVHGGAKRHCTVHAT